MKSNRLACMLALLCAVLVLTGCSELIPKRGQNQQMYSRSAVPTQTVPAPVEETTAPADYSRVEELTISVTEKTIGELEKYTGLKKLDLLDSTCYTAILVYMRNHPEVEVTYYVDFGGTLAANWTEDIALMSDSVSYETMLRNLRFLPKLRSVRFQGANMTAEQIAFLRKAYPDVSLSYTVEYQGRELDLEATELNMAGMTTADLTAAVYAMQRMPNLQYVELMDENGFCSLTPAELITLRDALPGVGFHYTFELFGKTVSATDERITFKNLSLTEEAEGEIRAALSIMAPGSALVLDRCGLSSEFLDTIRRDYTDVDLVWRVYFGTDGRYTTLTDDDTIRCVYNVTDDTCYQMRYLRSVRYMDLGHNDTLTDLSFLGYMPELEIAILSGCAAKHLRGIENCKKLELLEIANCMQMEDISALAGCSSLKYLNICYTKVSDLSALEELDIQNFFCKQTRVNWEQQDGFARAHPDATAVFTGREAYAGPGWRYVDNGITFTDFYKHIREVFNLDAVDQNLKAQEAAAD